MRGSKVSRRYAKALMSLGREDGNYGVYGENLKEFSSLWQKNEEFALVISNQVFKVEDRRAILKTILERSDLSTTVKNFLYLLLDKNRISAIQEITDHYERFTDDLADIVRAEITATRTLRSDEQDRLKKVLEDMTSKNIRIEVTEDKRLIGGIIVKIGDLVLDGSIRAQLDGLKELLKKSEYN